jgi:hypothetical protein
MGRPSLNLSDEEKKKRKQEYNRRYRSTEKGKIKTYESIKKYQENSEKYKEYHSKYAKEYAKQYYQNKQDKKQQAQLYN